MRFSFLWGAGVCHPKQPPRHEDDFEPKAVGKQWMGEQLSCLPHACLAAGRGFVKVSPFPVQEGLHLLPSRAPREESAPQAFRAQLSSSASFSRVYVPSLPPLEASATSPQSCRLSTDVLISVKMLYEPLTTPLSNRSPSSRTRMHDARVSLLIVCLQSHMMSHSQ